MSMALKVTRAFWRVVPVRRGFKVERAYFHFILLGMTFIGLAGSGWAPGLLIAAPQQQNAAGPQFGAPVGAERPGLKTEPTLISSNDVLFIQVFDVDQMTREYRVSATGTVDFPLIAQPISVAGLTPQQAAQAISQKCVEARVLTRPQISITIRESRVHSVTISGAVRNPQLFPVFGRISLLDLLAQAGGLSEDAGSTVTIARGEASRQMLASGDDPPTDGADAKATSAPGTVNIDLRRLQETGDPSLNLDVYPGDRVTVQRAGIVYVVGAVGRPGAYSMTEAHREMTVLKALSLAGSLNNFAKSKKAVLLRYDPSAPKGRDEISLDLHAMLRGNIADKSLVKDDILFVPDSTALKALHRGADAAAMAGAWVAVYAVAP
jgi:polysaccharide biosynthesis/export protein